MEFINKRIKNEVCYETIKAISDESLLEEFMNCESSKKQVTKLENILSKYVNNATKDKIINEYILQLIPPGTKGVIRGNKFNAIIKKRITDLGLDKTQFDIGFEKQPEGYNSVDEKPDWYILDKNNKKILIGMNQLDLWGGGAQCNRGSKYILNTKYNNDRSKLLCVVCNEIQFRTTKNKTYRLFTEGYNKDTLCYLNNLPNIILKYFEII